MLKVIDISPMSMIRCKYIKSIDFVKTERINMLDKENAIRLGVATLASVTALALFFAGYNAGHDDGQAARKPAPVTTKTLDVETLAFDRCIVIIHATGDFNSRYCYGMTEDDPRLESHYKNAQPEYTKITTSTTTTPQIFISSTVVTRDGE